VLTVPITPDHIQRASLLLKDIPIYRGSHREQAANEVGVLGEIIVREQVKSRGITLKPIFTTTHDLELSTGYRIEVKTKDRTVTPQPDYECSVPIYNHDHQNVEYYIFVSLQRGRSDKTEDLSRFKTAHIVGVANQKMMDDKGVTREKGETDPRNGTTFWTACRNIYIRDLVPLEIAIAHWKKAGAN